MFNKVGNTSILSPYCQQQGCIVSVQQTSPYDNSSAACNSIRILSQAVIQLTVAVNEQTSTDLY